MAYTIIALHRKIVLQRALIRNSGINPLSTARSFEGIRAHLFWIQPPTNISASPDRVQDSYLNMALNCKMQQLSGRAQSETRGCVR